MQKEHKRDKEEMDIIMNALKTKRHSQYILDSQSKIIHYSFSR